MRLNKSKTTLFESFVHNLNEGSDYELYDEVFWIGAGNEIGATGKIVEFPEEGRMTIKWDDGDVNTYSLNHPNIQKATEYDNSFNECSKPKKDNKHTIKEDIQGGHTIKINGKDKTIYKDYYVVLSNSDGVDFTAEEFDTEDEADDWAKRQASYNGFGAFVHETESDEGIKYYDPGDMGYGDESDEESFTMYNDDYDKEVKVWKQDGKWYDEEGNRYMGYLSKQDVKNYFKGNWYELNEAIEQKYEKSNDDYNSLLRDVKKYTGSYTYMFGGSVPGEYLGYPITVKYFYYERPYDRTTYNLVINVLAPFNTGICYSVNDALEEEFEPLKYNRLSQKEIKEKIRQVIDRLNSEDEKENITESVNRNFKDFLKEK